MAQTGFRDRLNELKEENSLSYTRFSKHGKEFIEVIDDGIPEIDALWVSADEIYEASDADKSGFEEGSGNRRFTSIYNLLCNAEVLDPFHDSEPYEINTSNYDKEPLIKAYEYVSGEKYPEDEGDEDLKLEEKKPEDIDDLYEELKD